MTGTSPWAPPFGVPFGGGGTTSPSAVDSAMTQVGIDVIAFQSALAAAQAAWTQLQTDLATLSAAITAAKD